MDLMDPMDQNIVKMASTSGLNNDVDSWLNFDSPMFTFVNPNEVCPLEIAAEYQVENCPNVANQVEISSFTTSNFTTSYHQNQQVHIAPPLILQNLQEVQLYQPQEPFKIEVLKNHTMVEPPPTLSSYDEPKTQLQKQLRLHKALSKQRHERLKAHLERNPPLLQLKGKGPGKKMTGRERQLELERQEAEQLRLREHYLAEIEQKERKCTRLRQILENIVATSPEYNHQMVNYLEVAELLYDQNDPTLQDNQTTSANSINSSDSNVNNTDLVINQDIYSA